MDDLIKRLNAASESLHMPPSVQSIRNIRCMEAMDEAAAALTEAQATIARLEAALIRQGDNMAFVLNHMTMPDGYYGKFIRELEEDRAALSPGKGE